MAETTSKVPLKTEAKSTAPTPAGEWRPLENLRREIDRLFHDFDSGFWRAPLRSSMFDLTPASWRGGLARIAMPAMDIVEKDTGYEVTAELPGMDEKNIEVQVANGQLTIKGEKKEEKEETKQDYHLSERHFGSFERRVTVPDDVDAEKIEAKFTKGVLMVSLPKKPEALKAAKKISVKAA